MDVEALIQQVLVHPLGLPAIVGLAAAGIAYALLYPLLSGEARAEKRQAQFVRSDAKVVTRGVGDATQRKKQIADSLKEMENREKGRNRATLEQRIAQAGLLWSKQQYFLISAVLGLVFGGLVFFVSGEPLGGIAGLLAGGLGIPQWLLIFLRGRRVKKFVVEFPNAVDVIVRGVKAGLPLGDCLRIIATEAAEPVKGEFKKVVDSQQIGVNIGDACAEIYKRIPAQEANFFGIVIQIQQKSGGNLSEVLGNLSRVLRDRKKMKGKVEAMSMEAKASAAIIGALPFAVAIMTYLSSPAYIEMLWTTETGKIVIVVSLIWMFIGIMVMKKMINFDI
jgi:tight adherence protein B